VVGALATLVLFGQDLTLIATMMTTMAALMGRRLLQWARVRGRNCANHWG